MNGKMDETEKKNLYNSAWNHWGSTSQIDMLIEEMAELTHAILGTRRNGVTYSYAFSEEIADVIICLEQIETRMKDFPLSLSQGTLWDQVLEIKEMKLERLKNRLMEDIERNLPEGIADTITDQVR